METLSRASNGRKLATASARRSIKRLGMMTYNRLTRAELDAVVGIAGDVDALATIESAFPAEERDTVLAAWESGMEKLRRQLGRKRR
jgi:hypothetical protein